MELDDSRGDKDAGTEWSSGQTFRNYKQQMAGRCVFGVVGRGECIRVWAVSRERKSKEIHLPFIFVRMGFDVVLRGRGVQGNMNSQFDHWKWREEGIVTASTRSPLALSQA